LKKCSFAKLETIGFKQNLCRDTAPKYMTRHCNRISYHQKICRFIKSKLITCGSRLYISWRTPFKSWKLCFEVWNFYINPTWMWMWMWMWMWTVELNFNCSVFWKNFVIFYSDFGDQVFKICLYLKTCGFSFFSNIKTYFWKIYNKLLLITQKLEKNPKNN
jgi:hypothetical protein